MRYFLMIALASMLLGFTSPPQQPKEYTPSEVITAYEAGQFRIIYTRSVWLNSSPDGAYVAATGDGVYRISDGTFYPQYDNAIFSPDSLYVAQGKDGLYRLSNGHKLTDIWELPRFTLNGLYAAVDGYGVFRLSDGYKLFDIDNSDAYSDGYVYSFFSHFSPHDTYVVIDKDGVYRLKDQHKLFDIDSEGFVVNFSSDEQYAASGDGVYRLSDGQKLLGVEGYYFSPDGNYIVSDNAVYRLSDSKKLFTIANGLPAFSNNSAYIAVAYDGIYNLEAGEKLFNISADGVFSPNGLYAAISNDGVYQLSNGQKIFDIKGIAPKFSENSAYLITTGKIFGDDLGSVYRVSDGHSLFSSHYSADLSPDGLYAALGTDGLYRISDAQRIGAIEEVNTTFTNDGNYIVASSADNNSVYRVSDGHRYRGLKLLNIAAGIMAVGNAILVVDPTQHQQPMFFVRTKKYTNHPLYAQPYNESRTFHINGGEYMAVLDEQGKWYQVGYNGINGWVSADSVELYYLPE